MFMIYKAIKSENRFVVIRAHESSSRSYLLPLFQVNSSSHFIDQSIGA